jgi:hypothetical protein
MLNISIKLTVTIVLVFVASAIAAVMTKPSDERCMELVRSKINTEIHNSASSTLITGIGSVLTNIGVNKILFRFEDKVFYKNIYFIGDNSKIGTAIYGTIIFSSE